MCRATGFGGDGPGKIVGATLVDIEDGECPGTRGGDRECNRSACATGADEKNGFVRRVIAFPLHPEHTTEAIEHGTGPASIVMATDDVECADLTGGRMQFVDTSQHPLLVRHRDEQPGEICHRSCTGDECGQIIRLDHQRDANRIDALFDEEPVQ